MKDMQQAIQSQSNNDDCIQLLQDIQSLYAYDLSQTISSFDLTRYLVLNSQINQVGESLKKLRLFINNDAGFAGKQHEAVRLTENIQKPIHHLKRELAVRKENLEKLKKIKQSLFAKKD
ncbi:unnamed protein product [Blepharisma stoltei]|uniref:Biogenesis of lysosome-related organelles complex 1 subunit 7 n=1 Tax=Blepharisma stoltei TaxID=1481888 RepID=A0AAU9JPD8_9CILI|nr:unnamed protein product [Blepharisma stoltei]